MQTDPSQPVLTVIFGALLALAALAGPARVAHAESVYKCRNADGTVAFQDRACAVGAAQSQVDIAPPPPAAPSPDYGRERNDAGRSVHAASSSRASTRERREAVSYECRAANGEVFYRHGACPGRITADAGAAKRGRGSSTAFAVTSAPLPRGEACRRMAAAGSIGRAGHARDESVSTYDRNLGRDPCRYY